MVTHQYIRGDNNADKEGFESSLVLNILVNQFVSLIKTGFTLTTVCESTFNIFSCALSKRHTKLIQIIRNRYTDHIYSS